MEDAYEPHEDALCALPPARFSDTHAPDAAAARACHEFPGRLAYFGENTDVRFILERTS
jgi:hypothetical protein